MKVGAVTTTFRPAFEAALRLFARASHAMVEQAFLRVEAPRRLKRQARALFDLHPGLDVEYLEQRVRYETGGDLGVADLQI